MSTWQLIDSPPFDISSQMALDRELFDDFCKDPTALPILRIFRVSEPTISVGYSYRNDTKMCIRPTGGGLVEHGNDLIYSVIARRGTFPTFHMVRTSYLSFHEAVMEAFAKLGIETHLMRCDDPRLRRGVPRRVPTHVDDDNCFTNSIATDVLIGDQKIAGGAQRRKGLCFLHQGSIQLVNGITFEDLKPVLIEAFEKKFQIHWETAYRVDALPPSAL